MLLLGDFCAKDSYSDLLKALHINIIELTGNHNDDYGYDAFLRTLSLYHQHGIATFGGGATQADSQTPLMASHNGDLIMFVGCNSAGPTYAWATDTTPGAARCDDRWLQPLLASHTDAVKVMDVQYDEYEQTWPTPQHRDYFARLAAFGADVVIGTQAHIPQTIAFVGDKFIHFGLGNFIFDQQLIQETKFFVDKLILYRGRLISVQLLTGIIEDRARPRPMTDGERKLFLSQMFYLSQRNVIQP
jgi:poly-gamma-glutamate synthesis protein (capsule biosynthesis protein)